MTKEEARKLKIGYKVDGFKTQGVVVDRGYDAVKIKWDDGQTGVIHEADMHGIYPVALNVT
jgi:hypothetical protein